MLATKISSSIKIIRYRFRDFFLVPNFTIPILRFFPGTKFLRYQFRYFFLVPICSNIGSDTTKNMKNSRYREFPIPVRHTLLDRTHRYALNLGRIFLRLLWSRISWRQRSSFVVSLEYIHFKTRVGGSKPI